MSNPYNHGEFSLNVPDLGDTGWQGDQAANDRALDVQIDRLFPGYDLFTHDRNQDFDLPGIVPARQIPDNE